MDEFDLFLESLRARVDGCWDRLDDVVSELLEVHGASSEEVVARVVWLAKLAEFERGSGDALAERRA